MQTIKRDTQKDLFKAILRLVKDNGHFDKAEAILDYYLPSEKEELTHEPPIEISNYRFDTNALVYLGGSEGIWINCYIEGEFTENQSESKKLHIGTFKTLKRDINSMKIMGELCGAITYYADRYVNQNINRYTPADDLQAEQKRKESNLKTILTYDEVRVLQGSAIVKMENADYYKVDEIVKIVIFDKIYKGIVIKSSNKEIEIKTLQI